MNERELLNEITHTHLKDIIEWKLTKTNETIPNTNGLYDNIIPFLIMKCHMNELLDTVITNTITTINIDIKLDSYITADNFTRLATYNIDGTNQQMYDKYTYSGHQMMNVTAYNEKQLNEIFPTLIEDFPFMVINEISKQVNKDREILDAIATYVNDYYIKPLKEKVPELECEYASGYFVATFIVNISKCPHVKSFLRRTYSTHYNIMIEE